MARPRALNRTSRLLLAAVLLALAVGLLMPSPGPVHGSSHDLPGKPSISNWDRMYNGLRVHWNAPASDGGSPIIRYEVQYKRPRWEIWEDGPQVGTARKATIKSLGRDIEYQVRVRAVTSNGAGPWTDDPDDKRNSLGLSSQADPPDVTIIPRNASLTLSWDVEYLGSLSLSHYNVQYARFDGNTYTYEDWTVGGSTRIAGNSVTITDLENGQNYLVRVRAHNGIKDGHWSVGHHGAPATGTPFLKVEELVTGLQVPWDLDFTPDGTMLFTQRAGRLSARLTDGTVRSLARVQNTKTTSEGGLMSILVDPGFSTNRRFYTCQTNNNAQPPNYESPSSPYSVEVIVWTVNADYTTATRAANPLVGGIPGGTFGQHNGCRLRFGPDGYLWIATGDAVGPTNPQSLSSLGGKVLRVVASTGNGAPGNPFRSSPRVYTYGHRNIQGLALRPDTRQMWAVEHGSIVDDEINLLAAGKNYGWDPAHLNNEGETVYSELQVPMTDLEKYPSAVEAQWSSGESTLATSGGIFLEGERWGDWEGRLAVATLKDSQLHLFAFDEAGHFQNRISVPALRETHGRLRSPVIGPDGALYITTSNGENKDKILKVTPVYHPGSPAGLTVVPGSAVGELVVTWTAPTDDGGDPVTGYRLRYSTDGTNWTDVADTVAGLTETITGLDDGVEYRVQVRAVNGAAGGGAWSQSGTGNAGSSNQAPTVANAIEDVTFLKESGTRDVSLSGVFTDADNDSLTITAVSSADSKAAVSVATDFSKLTVTARARGTVTITVTADDGNGGTGQDSFTVTVKAAPVVSSALSDVSGLATESARDISLSGVFTDADGDSLTITARSSSNVRARALVAADYSSLTVAGVTAGTATITVTAQDSDGNQVSDAFDVEVVRSAEAGLSALSLSAGSISPSFSATTYTYTLNVGHDVSSTTVTATASHGRATLKAGLAGSLSAITSGTPSGDISLAPGANSVQVEVTAEDGMAQQTYTITVTREASSDPVIQFSSATYSGTEGDTITIRLRLAEAQPAPFRVWVRADPRSDASHEPDFSFGDCLPGETSCDFGIGVLDVTIPAGDTTYDYGIRTVDDHRVEGSETFTLDFVYVGSPYVLGDNSQAVVTIEDNDEAGVIVSTETVSMKEDTTGNEEADATYTIRLDSQPADWVRVYPESAFACKVGVIRGFVEFSRHNWDQPQTVRLRAEHDFDAVDEEVVISHRVEAASASAEYRTVTVPSVTVSVDDKHTPALMVEKSSLTPAAGETVQYRVYLSADPSPVYGENPADCYDYSSSHTVTIAAASSDTDKVTVSPASVTFTADDYEPKTIYVTGVSAGDVTITHTVSGTDPEYTGTPLVLQQVAVSVPAQQQSAQEPSGEPQETPEPEGVQKLPGPVLEVQLAATSDSLTVRWNAPETGDPPTRYIVHIAPVGGGKGELKTPKAKKTSVTFRGLEAGETYRIFVRAKNQAGKGPRVKAIVTLPEAPPG